MNQFKRRKQTQASPIYISGELTTIPAAAQRVGMTADQFARKRAELVRSLPNNERVEWHHFEK